MFVSGLFLEFMEGVVFQPPFDLIFLAAHSDSGHDGVQEESASVPPGQTSHQLHGSQTVSKAGRSTQQGGTEGGPALFHI